MAGAAVADASMRCAAPHAAQVLVRRHRVLAWKEMRPPAPTEIHFGRANPISVVVACIRPSGRRHILYKSLSGLFPPHIGSAKVARAKLAFFVEVGGGFGSEGLLSEFDVRSGRQLFNTTFALSTDYFPSKYSSLVDYALDANGDLAWIERAGERRVEEGSTAVDYLRLHAGKGARVLESASSITHVTIEGGRVDWVAEGRTRSEPLPSSTPQQ
jgi:hypothetical protein